MLTAAGANAGVLRGLPCLLGVVTGMGAMMFLVPLGLGSLVLRGALGLRGLPWGGARRCALVVVKEREVEPARVEARRQSGRLWRRRRLPVDQPQIVAGERQ